MAETRLQPLDLVDFVGGLNVRRSQFTLADNESPDMLNMEIDPRIGFFTRRGWQRWNTDDIADPSTWDPRSAKLHPLSTGLYDVYVAAADDVYVAGPTGVFSALGLTPAATPHRADYAAWGDAMYLALGSSATAKRDGGVVTSFPVLVFNDDYTTPVQGYFPIASFCETHAGYMFVADTTESGIEYPNRIRWSHPNQPEDWATEDYLDIERGGGRITGLLSFRDHLLIFKTDSVWALYGYDLESWQLVQVSMSVGTPSITAVTRNETAVFFFSASDRGGIYAYGGENPTHITEPLRTVMEEITLVEDVWLGWLGRRLWCSLPYQGNSVFVFDPEIGNGAWVKHRAAVGSVGPLVERSDVDAEYPLAVMRGDSGSAAVVRLDFRSDARDVIRRVGSVAITDLNGAAEITDLTTGEAIEDGGQSSGTPFDAWYRTSWKHAGWPERRKSWRRPRYVVNKPDQDVVIRANVYWDYDETNVRRSAVAFVQAQGGIYWRALGADDPAGDGFDWGDGSLWGAQASGSSIERVVKGLGVNRAIQIEVRSDSSTPGRAWGINSIHLKWIPRRFTT